MALGPIRRYTGELMSARCRAEAGELRRVPSGQPIGEGMAPRIVLAAGDEFGRLIVVTPGSSALCRCDCGTEVTVPRKNLASGHTRSCGCLSREAAGARMAAQNAQRAVAGVARQAPVPVTMTARVADPEAARAANQRRAAAAREKRAADRRVAEMVRAAEPQPSPPATADEMLPNLMARARATAWKHYSKAPAALDLEELQGAALAGLAEALARWPAYCSARGFRADGPGLAFLGAYCQRRVNGEVIDSLRKADHLSRSLRGRAGRLRDAGMDAGATEGELAARTGLTPRQVRETAAALAARPVSLQSGETSDAYEVPDPREDTEGAAVAASITGALVTAIRAMPPESRVVLILRYYEGQYPPQIAELTGLSEDRVKALHDDGVRQAHAAMAGAAAAR